MNHHTNVYILFEPHYISEWQKPKDSGDDFVWRKKWLIENNATLTAGAAFPNLFILGNANHELKERQTAN